MFTDIELQVGLCYKAHFKRFVLQINTCLSKVVRKFSSITFQQQNDEQLVTEYKVKAPKQALYRLILAVYLCLIIERQLLLGMKFNV